MHKSQTIKVGLLGWPVAHSFSPVIHQAAFDFQQLPWRYELLPVEPAQFSHGIRQILDSDIRGFNITAPYKEKIVEYLDDCDDSCRLIKAVNTGSHTANGKWIGSNTDVIGLLKAFECTGLFTKPLKKITILGNGGAAKAVLVAFNELKISQI
jgi:shikimate dehydrogenase